MVPAMLDLSSQGYANIRSEISQLTRVQQHEVGPDILLRNAAHTALMPNDDRGKSKADI
jgi:hypothetical protein